MFQRPTAKTQSRPLFFVRRRRTWRHIWLSLAASLAFVFQARPSDALAENFSPIKVQLVADQLAFQPGIPFYVGLHQSIQPGYHTYWRNPGTVGLPSAIEWIVPEGFTAGPLLWPVPQISQMVDYKIWGYRSETLLIAKITPPKNLPSKTPVRITANASWMCCGRQCHPGFEALSINLKSSENAAPNPQWKALFDEVRQEQPQAFKQWAVQAIRKRDRYLLTLTTQNPLPPNADATIQFFGYHRQVSSAKPQSVQQLPNGVLLTLHHEEFSGEDRNTLSGMVVADFPWDPDHPKSPLLIQVPLRNASTP